MKLKINNIKIVLLAPIIIPTIAIVSCGNSKKNDEFISDSSLYSDIWDTAYTKVNNNIPNNELFNLSISEINKKLNNIIESDSKIKKIMQIYCFQLLYKAIRHPYDTNGKEITNLNSNLTSYTQYLIDKTKPDNEKADDEDKKYNNFDKFLDSFIDIKINVLAFSKNKEQVTLNNTIKVGEKLNEKNNNNGDRLNFQITFKSKDEEINKKILNKDNETIFLKTKKTREQRALIKQYANNKDKNVFNLINNQYLYQGTKLYYEDSTFKTIVLKDNVNKDKSLPTPNSGFIQDVDTERKLLFFDFKQSSSNEYNQYLVLDLNNSSYFDTNITSNFNKYLKWKGYYKDSKMDKIEFNLNESITYKKND